MSLKKDPEADIKENIGSGGITWSNSYCKCECKCYISCAVKHLRKCRIERGCTMGITEYGKGENVHRKKLIG